MNDLDRRLIVNALRSYASVLALRPPTGRRTADEARFAELLRLRALADELETAARIEVV